MFLFRNSAGSRFDALAVTSMFKVARFATDGDAHPGAWHSAPFAPLLHNNATMNVSKKIVCLIIVFNMVNLFVFLLS